MKILKHHLLCIKFYVCVCKHSSLAGLKLTILEQVGLELELESIFLPLPSSAKITIVSPCPDK